MFHNFVFQILRCFWKTRLSYKVYVIIRAELIRIKFQVYFKGYS